MDRLGEGQRAFVTARQDLRAGERGVAVGATPMVPLALASSAACLALIGAVVACSATAPRAGLRSTAAAARAPRVAVSAPTGSDVFYLTRCPQGMASIDGRFCIDRWEASLVEVLAGDGERPWSAFLPEIGRAHV